jgi:hypothetical protein
MALKRLEDCVNTQEDSCDFHAECNFATTIRKDVSAVLDGFKPSILTIAQLGHLEHQKSLLNLEVCENPLYKIPPPAWALAREG